MRNKIRDIRVGRGGKDLLRRAALHDSLPLHYGDPVAQLERFVQVMADKDDGAFQVPLKIQPTSENVTLPQSAAAAPAASVIISAEVVALRVMENPRVGSVFLY